MLFRSASAAFFAIAIAKHPFGGLGNNLFNPAASGISFAAICWPRLVFIYPMPFSRIGVLGTVAANATDYYYTYSSVNAQGIAQEISLRLYQNPATETKEAITMIVAQRIATIMDADQIIVLHEGKQVGCGTHRELLASCSIYYEIAASQLSEEELKL